ncbi:Uncharacterised protein [Kluyvera cryocrescens]|uniref:Uncharacterized protein n=1 Tax=Kluyvera cryocrescens TaxID=580 RepID=A0A485CSG1_KLUCR|nr:Uncharacterised protein [Kluyvera cryocrescens]
MPSGHWMMCIWKIWISSLIFYRRPIEECQVVAISDFVREFIHYATTNTAERFDIKGKDGQLVRVLLDVILQLPQVELMLPWPQNAALMKVCRTIQESPGLNMRWRIGLIISNVSPHIFPPFQKGDWNAI